MKTARRAPVVAAAHHGGNIQVWNLTSGERLLDFDTICDGGNRFAINQSGEIVVAANWESGPNAGVACYDARIGNVIWHRHDLSQVQHMRFSEHGPWIWFEVEGQSCHCLDTQTGTTLITWPTVRDVYDGPFSPRLFLKGWGDYGIGTREDHVALASTNGLFLQDAIHSAFRGHF